MTHHTSPDHARLTRTKPKLIRLHRSKRHRLMAGVFGGIAEYMGVVACGATMAVCAVYSTDGNHYIVWWDFVLSYHVAHHARSER